MATLRHGQETNEASWGTTDSIQKGNTGQNQDCVRHAPFGSIVQRHIDMRKDPKPHTGMSVSIGRKLALKTGSRDMVLDKKIGKRDTERNRGYLPSSGRKWGLRAPYVVIAVLIHCS